MSLSCVVIAVGDDERRLRLTVSKGCDRYSDTVVLVQSGKLPTTYLSPVVVLIYCLVVICITSRTKL